MQNDTTSNPTPNYYEVLQLQPFANPALVTAAYRILSKLYHPDTAREGANLELFRLLQAAYDTLSDPQRRLEYDSELRLKTPGNAWAQARAYDFKPEPEERQPLWETHPAAGPDYKPSAEDLSYYNSLDDYQDYRKRRRTLLLISVYVGLMVAAMVFGVLGFITIFSGEADSEWTAIIYFAIGIFLLVLAQLEAYLT